MIWTIVILNFLYVFGPGRKIDVVGSYVHSENGVNSTSWSTSRLELNCDSTVSVDLRTHGGQTKWEGFWRTHNDTLIVNIKPIITEDGKKYLGSWGNVNQFLIGKRDLTPVVTKIKGEEIKDKKVLKVLNRQLKMEKYKKTLDKNCL
jgi:hypothetical protein